VLSYVDGEHITHVSGFDLQQDGSIVAHDASRSFTYKTVTEYEQMMRNHSPITYPLSISLSVIKSEAYFKYTTI
jgi:hypothetical protein